MQNEYKRISTGKETGHYEPSLKACRCLARASKGERRSVEGWARECKVAPQTLHKALEELVDRRGALSSYDPTAELNKMIVAREECRTEYEVDPEKMTPAEEYEALCNCVKEAERAESPDAVANAVVNCLLAACDCRNNDEGKM